MSKVSTLTFVSASCLGLLPTQALNAYLGATLRSAQDISDQQSFSNVFLVFQVKYKILKISCKVESFDPIIKLGMERKEGVWRE